ncbi:hypothetical protein KY289_032260 [Solanum tuberosum]|nr:hypothetical protein KY289_032260 [Solanum tuberosum]
MDVCDDIRNRLNEQQFLQFKESPFGLFLDMPHIKVQPQLLRSLLLVETKNDRDDMFIVNVNDTELKFGIREFAVITGLKCGLDSDFYSDLDSPNRLLAQYFPGIKLVRKPEFINAFNAKDFIEPGDVFKMALVYFIETFLLSAEPNNNFVSKLHFDLVETGEYKDYPWGNLCFRTLLKNCSHKLGKNPSSFKFGGFHLALQIWFYECCSKVDRSVATRICTTTPRILNWRTSDSLIYFEFLKNTMFRKYGNQIKFSNIVLTDVELADMDPSIMPESTNNQDEGIKMVLTDEERYLRLKNEIVNVREDLKDLRTKVDDHIKDLKAYIDDSMKLLIEEFRSSKKKSSETPTHEKFSQFKNVSQRRNRKSAYTAVYDKLKPKLDLGIVKVKKMDWLHIMVHDGRPWEDEAVESIARMIPLFFSSIGYYGKRSDIQWRMEPAYFDKSEMEPLEYKLQRNIPQQHPDSNFKIFNVFSDSGLYACVFAELITHGVFEIPSQCFMPKLHRKRYSALLWEYATSKLSQGAISEGEVSGKFASKLGEPSINRDIVRDCQKFQMPNLRPRVYK